jgi:hypothetical protein
MSIIDSFFLTLNKRRLCHVGMSIDKDTYNLIIGLPWSPKFCRKSFSAIKNESYVENMWKFCTNQTMKSCSFHEFFEVITRTRFRKSSFSNIKTSVTNSSFSNTKLHKSGVVVTGRKKI